MQDDPLPLPLVAPTSPAASDPDDDTFTVTALNDRIRWALRAAFDSDVWVRGQIVDLQRPNSGHRYFSLSDGSASIPVRLWDSDRQVVNSLLNRSGGAVKMTDGTEIRIRAQVTFWPERGQLALRMLSIDPSYTLGRLAEAREILLAQLKAEGTLERQHRHRLTAVPLRVGLITSAGSAAEADFLRTLHESRFAFEVLVADARVQGPEAEHSVVRALQRLEARVPDVICIVRGGGARTDLAAFDLEAVARAIAGSSVPVMTGIGHEIDTSVADLVAFLAHKTPTACAGHLVERVTAFCALVDDRTDAVARAATSAIARSETRTLRAAASVSGGARAHLRSDDRRLERARERLSERPGHLLRAESRTLEAVRARVGALDPAKVLARGWSITRTASGTVLRSAATVAPGEELVTTLSDGELRSTVTP